jgi:hypothetical protein
VAAHDEGEIWGSGGEDFLTDGDGSDRLEDDGVDEVPWCEAPVYRVLPE